MRRALVLVIAVAATGCGGAEPPPKAAPRPVERATPRAHPRASAARQRAQLRRLTAIGRPVYCGRGRRRLVALTFDDGPGPYTRLALKELRAAGARATFFLVARSIRSFPAWPRRELADAALGDHTLTHPVLPLLSRAGMAREIAGGRRAVERAARVRVRIFRPPYGAFNRAVTRTARRLGMAEILWSVDSGDSLGGDFHAIAARVRHAVRPGAIVLFHENRGQTIRALRSLLPWLRRHHYRTVSVPELLALDPPARRQLRRGVEGCQPR